MKPVKLVALLLCYTLFTSLIAGSKGETWSNFALIQPLNDFADNDIEGDDLDNRAGGAGRGFALGFQYQYPVTKFGLYYLLGFNASFNRLHKDVRDELLEIYQDQGAYSNDIQYRNYINLPVFTGLKYKYTINEHFAVSTNIAVAYNYLIVTPSHAIYTGYNRVEVKYKLAEAAGIRLGGQIILNNKTALSVNLFKHDIHIVDRTVQQYREVQSLRPLYLNIDYLMVSINFLVK